MIVVSVSIPPPTPEECCPICGEPFDANGFDQCDCFVDGEATSQYIGKDDIWTSPVTPSKQNKEGAT